MEAATVLVRPVCANISSTGDISQRQIAHFNTSDAAPAADIASKQAMTSTNLTQQWFAQLAHT